MHRTHHEERAKGIKSAAAALNGAEIARSETYHEGTFPLQTLRADIDYLPVEANTTYGKIGVKVWIYKGEVLDGSKTGGRLSKLPRRATDLAATAETATAETEAAAETAETATAETAASVPTGR